MRPAGTHAGPRTSDLVLGSADVHPEKFHRRIPHYSIKAGEKPKYKPAIREVSYLPLVFGETKP